MFNLRIKNKRSNKHNISRGGAAALIRDVYRAPSPDDYKHTETGPGSYLHFFFEINLTECSCLFIILFNFV